MMMSNIKYIIRDKIVRARLLRTSSLQKMVLKQYLEEQVGFRLTLGAENILGRGNSQNDNDDWLRACQTRF